MQNEEEWMQKKGKLKVKVKVTLQATKVNGTSLIQTVYWLWLYLVG